MTDVGINDPTIRWVPLNETKTYTEGGEDSLDLADGPQRYLGLNLNIVGDNDATASFDVARVFDNIEVTGDAGDYYRVTGASWFDVARHNNGIAVVIDNLVQDTEYNDLATGARVQDVTAIVPCWSFGDEALNLHVNWAALAQFWEDVVAFTTPTAMTLRVLQGFDDSIQADSRRLFVRSRAHDGAADGTPIADQQFPTYPTGDLMLAIWSWRDVIGAATQNFYVDDITYELTYAGSAAGRGRGSMAMAIANLTQSGTYGSGVATGITVDPTVQSSSTTKYSFTPSAGVSVDGTVTGMYMGQAESGA